VVEALGWLARVNAGIAIFNLLPGFPLDGGRIVRGAVWATWRDPHRGTVAAASVGRGIGWALITVGVMRALLGWIGDGVWMALVGGFLLSASRAAIEALPVGSYVELLAAKGSRCPPVAVDHDNDHDHDRERAA
jgi:Zn-dependent protease